MPKTIQNLALENSASQVYVGKSALDPKSVCTLTIQKDKNGKTIGMKLAGLGKNKGTFDDSMRPVDIEVGAQYQTSFTNDPAWNPAEIKFDNQLSVKYPGFMRIAYMKQTGNSDEIIKGIEGPAKLILKAALFNAHSESFIVVNAQNDKVIGYTEGGSPLELASEEVTCENMKAVN